MTKVIKSTVLASYSLYGKKGKKPFYGTKLCTSVFGEPPVFTIILIFFLCIGLQHYSRRKSRQPL